MSTPRKTHIIFGFFAALSAFAISSCQTYQFEAPFITKAPFGYDDDRCAGQFNQCRTQCLGAPSAISRSACDSQCLDRETQCYAVGTPGVEEPLSQTGSISAYDRELQKEQAWRAFKLKKERERADAKAADADVSSDTVKDGAGDQTTDE